MLSRPVILIAVLVLAGIGLYYFMPFSEEAQARSITVPLATQNNSGESGSATLTESGGRTVVALSLSGAPQGVTQPAHIHIGSCASIGGVKYPLTSPVNGISETTLDVTLDSLLAQLPLALNVHKSESEAGVYVACGDIRN